MTELVAVLDNIRNAENVGSIFRTCDAAGFTKVYLGGITPTPNHPKVKKASLGAENFIVWEKAPKTFLVLKNLKNQGFLILGLEQSKKSISVFKFKPRQQNLVLVIGNEVKGLSQKILRYCDKVLEIPMKGKKESLNVAVAFGIAAYQITKSNGAKRGSGKLGIAPWRKD